MWPETFPALVMDDHDQGPDEEIAVAEAMLAKATERLDVAHAHLTDMRARIADGKARAAADAVRDLSKGDVDEIRALKIAPPPIVQLIVCCVCTLLGADEAKRRSWAGTVSTAALKRQGGLASWEEAQKMLAKADFKPVLLAYDPAVLLTQTDAIDAVRGRIQIASDADKPRPAPKLAAVARRAAQELSSAAAAQRASRELSSIAAARLLRTVAYAQEASALQTGAAEVTLAPLSIEEVSSCSRVAGKLAHWCSRVLANVAALQAVAAESDTAAVASITTCGHEVERARAALASAQRAAELRAEAAVRLAAEKAAAAEQEARAAEVAAAEMAEAERKAATVRRAEVEREHRRRAKAEAEAEAEAEVEKARRVAMREAHERQLDRDEAAAAERVCAGTLAEVGQTTSYTQELKPHAQSHTVPNPFSPPLDAAPPHAALPCSPAPSHPIPRRPAPLPSKPTQSRPIPSHPTAPRPTPIQSRAVPPPSHPTLPRPVPSHPSLPRPVPSHPTLLRLVRWSRLTWSSSSVLPSEMGRHWLRISTCLLSSAWPT